MMTGIHENGKETTILKNRFFREPNNLAFIMLVE